MSEESQNDGSKKSPLLAAPNEAGLQGEECGAQVDATTYTSHTNVTQVTASSAPTDSSNKWKCDMCTYENFPLSRKCTMCRSLKPSLGEDIFKLQDGASALPTQDICGADAIAERLKPLRISSPQGQAGASSVAKWSCATCTYENWPRALKCAMCGAATTHSTGINDICNSQNAALHEVESGGRRSKRRNTDWVWLQACLGVVEGDARCVQAYLSAGGDPARALTAHEVALLDRASAFDPGHTLVHLAIRFQRQEILSTLLSRISGGGPGLKRSPSYVAPDLATAIRRHIANCIRHKKGSFPCRYINEFCTFSLPAEIEELPAAIQEQLFSELLDRDAQHTLEEPPLINWSLHLTVTLGSRLYALWNRSAGDCLPDAVCQAAYGVFDRANVLRAALADSLHHAQRSFYARWTAWERLQAAQLHYQPEETQLRAEWARLVAAAARPGTALHQLHVFALAHVMRRPIFVYGVDVVNSFRGEALGYARFQGIYLPLLWEPEFCSKSPLCLGYTRGHFSALVPVEPYSQRHDYICREQQEDSEDTTYLPLTDSEGKLLPVHFLTCDEVSEEEALVRRWVRARASGGALAAAQTLHARPLLQAQMLEEWLNHYRRLAQQTRGPFPPRLHAEYSSDADTDDE
ncbi:ubiquitin thioesterase trabid [Nymphalis io]|uniref:ubiquitin thioesterase trabid n=1 Tax=Inachis io TaxID=171585 RepID=UPI002169932E|nr:ubiquitin thioesterase trabid [Nymphalis io]XP_050357815.1 ubiquitin thioesterase trabid [Nymphalis io]XP_050357816.1 ubiquitin thioesterase trabid [Nymphalis io]XP_050357817.1 ubiquitin thioesterase trabid [Nymphalis io]XP_050357818.1 ubiquitin thioesterase trabid [Nymphalis io]